MTLNNKNILISGGSGTIGSALVEYLLTNYSPKVIRILSRDESKQHYLKNKFSKDRHKLRFFIGNIRDKERTYRAMENVDIVFHLAALKHVESCEYNPFEAIKTNIIGLQNLIEVCIDREVEKVIFTSTDKAATPCNTMGVTKLLGEKLITAANYYRGKSKPIFYSVRLGNILGSRGSLIPLVEEQFKNDLPITLTHNEMTRYIMNIESALKFMIKTLDVAQGGEVFVLKMKVVKIIDLIEVLIDHFSEKYKKNPEKVQIKEIGLFAGEKMYEELFSLEESGRLYEMDDMYMILPQITEVSTHLNLDKYPKMERFDGKSPFNSHDGPFYSKEEIKEFLIEYNIIKEI